MRKITKGIMAAILLPMLLVGCSSGREEKDSLDKKEEKEQISAFVEVPEKPETLPTATIKIKNYGTMEAELYPHKAPNTVNNFIELANKKFYDGLIIHRVQKDFVIQGGDPEGTGIGGPGYEIKGEFHENGFNTNDISHTKGVLSMARTQYQLDSAGSQFFIMTDDATQLDGAYAAFGKLISGEDVLDKLNVVKVNGQTPIERIEIESIKINLNGYNAKEAVKIKG